MIKKLYFVISLFIFSFLLTSKPCGAMNHLTGQELLDNCKVALDIFDKNFGFVKTDTEYLQGVKAGICEGYIMSANETLHPLRAKNRYCLPSDNDMRGPIAVVVKYLKNHPQELNLPASVLVTKTFDIYFSCK